MMRQYNTNWLLPATMIRYNALFAYRCLIGQLNFYRST